MRERWARWLALLTGLLVLLLSVGFGLLQNPPAAPPAAAAGRVADGAATPASPAIDAWPLFDQHGCQRCHSVAGVGNPRYPLDGVGARHEDEAMRHWIVGDDRLGDQITPRIRGAKQRYHDLPTEDLDALVAWLQTL
jgi:hypothetical protein